MSVRTPAPDRHPHPGGDTPQAVIRRAQEAPEEVVLRAEHIRQPGLQPEDLGILVDLQLRPANVPLDSAELLGEYRAGGWNLSPAELHAALERLTGAGLLQDGGDQ